MKYFPILLSKAGELKALKELNPAITDEISPIIEVLPNSLDRIEAKLIDDWSFAGNQALLDFSSYPQLAVDIANIRRLFDNLRVAGVNAIPVVQQGIANQYISLVNDLVIQHNYSVCIRASNANGGLINYNTQITTLMGQVGIALNKTILLIDLGYAQSHNYNNISALAIVILNAIPSITDWLDIVVASGSFPVDLSTLLPANTVHRIPRYEWSIWNTINANPNLNGIIKYGDYGNKNPVYGGESPYPGSCSIKYTAIDEFVIYRGTLAGEHPDGNGQYITFAGRLIHTPEYSGVGFSWGDAQINRIAHEVMANPRRKPGSATTWVEITQNHHITLLHSLL